MELKLKEDALLYHSSSPKGKIALRPTKPMKTQKDLSLAYTPGVAAPCLEIKERPDAVWDYTSRGNMVAVISDGTAVLGLGDIGPEAGRPVMEGKAVLFKRFADVDAFPIVLKDVKKDGQPDVQKIIDVVKCLEPSFGGVNLEDIKAPECFDIEQTLKKECGIPIFHDDQHGTAIITLAALLNALEMSGKSISKVKVVFNGAGAAALATAEYYVSAGVKLENITMCDSKGVIYKGREGVNKYKAPFAHETKNRILADALKGVDIFVGLSVGNTVTKDMVRSMAHKPIVIAMANPDPEILPNDAYEAGAFIVATGRSDYPNQVNNVLGFPGIFRGALDVRASQISEGMKRGASRALAELAKEEIPPSINAMLKAAYPNDAKEGIFDGKNPLKAMYVIPKPLDPRVVPRVAKYVAEAAMKEGIARVKLDLSDYEENVRARIEASHK